MVEVLGGRAREPTGPRRAPRTYPGPVQLQVRRVGPRVDVKVTPAPVQLLRADSKADRGISVPEARGPELDVARHAQSAKTEIPPSEGIDPTGREDETEKEDVGPSGRPFAAGFEHKSEPGVSGSRVRSEAGERNVAERRHGHPCGQQPMDEADGHRHPQGAEASRIGRRRRCRVWSAGFSDHRQQRSDAQSVSLSHNIIPERKKQ
ncbi:Uncharacterized protein DBV15_05623 [Temnothorax longispinosus]|uniref:Uncharacterized protein n=1 Tax=Temnothorax longispinosus TaxID=300112 RepID=A0A4S2K4J5_9HYME|nr:Uncharacterized protein DBV15_05623 [Temnothorax longispinosus]